MECATSLMAGRGTLWLLALALARALATERAYNVNSVRRAYETWLASGPFDCGMATRRGINGNPDPSTQANGALMRISPLGIFGANHETSAVEEWARLDASITHPHPVCGDCNALFAGVLSHIVKTGGNPFQVYEYLVASSDRLAVCRDVRNVVARSAVGPPRDYVAKQGWVPLRSVMLYISCFTLPQSKRQLSTLSCAVATPIRMCGALVGAVYGIESLPERWVTTVLNCRPDRGNARVRQPRPRDYWPVDVLELAESLAS